jgi:hypothetical protein
MFKRKKSPVVSDINRRVNWPDGLFVSTEEGVVWHILKSKKYRVFSKRVLDSWAVSPISGSTVSVSGLAYGGILGFRAGTVIEDISSGIIYLVSNNKRRKITDPDVLLMLALPIITVSKAEADIHEDGDPINEIY